MITTLIVDDEIDMRSLVRLVLEMSSNGIEVLAEAADGAEALEAFHALGPPISPSVVILDNRMPHVDGLTAAQQILAEFPDQQVVLFSAFLDDETQAAATALGIECVAKSDVADLPDVVNRLAAAATA